MNELWDVYLIPWNNHCKIYLQYCFHVILVPVNFVLGYQDIPTVSSYQSYLFGMLDKHNAQMLANEFKIHVKKKGKILLTKHTHVGCDDKLITYQLIEACFMQQMTTIRNVTWITRCMNITQTYRTIWTWYIFHTLSINTILKWKSKLFWLEFIIFYLIYKHTRWPFVFSCNGKHILQTSQWKKLFLPPIRQIPHPLQWYWSLSSSSNRLQIRHVYCKHVNIKNIVFLSTNQI